MSPLLRLLPAILVLLLLLLLPLAAAARPPVLPSPAALCENAIAAAEYVGHVPPRLLDAIARVESGRPNPDTGRLTPWPWTINA